jgi:MFS family permease
MSRVARLCGFKDPNEKLARLAWVNLVIGPSIVFTIMLSSTFYMIFVADTLGGGPGMFLEGLALVGVLVVIQMVIQTLLDYPTGTIGDMIGHRYVIASAYLMYGAAFYLTAILTPTTPFAVFVLIYVLNGLGSSQESGAWDAWFDNNYKIAAPSDVDRKEYGVYAGRMGTIATIMVMTALIPGGILAVIFSRMWVFQFEAIMCIVTAFVVLRLVTDFPEVEEEREERPSFGEYMKLLKSGASFVVGDPFVKYLLIGGMVAWSSIMVWGNLIVFPIFYAYLVTDVAVAGYRTLVRVPGLFTMERAGVWSQRFEPTKWIPRFRLMQSAGFTGFIIFAAITFVFPPATLTSTLVDIVVPFTEFVIMQVPPESLVPITLMFVIFALSGFFYWAAEILTIRIMIDVVPTKIRNSVYSLSPTMATVFAIPQIAIFGAAIQFIGFPATLVFTGFVSLIGVLMIRKGLSYPIPVTEERKQAKEQEAAMEQATIEEIESNPSGEAEEMPSGQD